MAEEMSLDMRGEEVHVGDRVAVAFRDSNTPELRTGKVIEFGSGGEGTWGGAYQTMTVEWEHSSRSWGMPVKSSIATKHKRFVRLG